MSESIPISDSIRKGLLSDVMISSTTFASDIDTLTEPGIWSINEKTLNTPDGIKYGQIMVQKGYFSVQKVYPSAKDVYYWRMKGSPSATTWGKWIKVQGAFLS